MICACAKFLLVEATGQALGRFNAHALFRALNSRTVLYGSEGVEFSIFNLVCGVAIRLNNFGRNGLNNTALKAPGMPVITELTPHQEDSGTTGLTVSWQPPSSPPCQPTYYEIKYYILQGDMCEDNSRDRIMTSAGTVNGSTFTFNVLELRPNSEYMVFVRGRTSSGYGDSDSQSATTGYSYPSGPPTNIQSSATKKRSIVFTWAKPECGHRNGPITSYEVMLSNSTGDVVYHGNVSASAEPEHEIFELIPSSNYSIRIRAWNYELAGEYGPAIWVQTN